MHLVFDADFDEGAWPGPLIGRDAAVGEAWVGPSGLVGALEVSLGLGGPQHAKSVRAAALIRAVTRTDGFWARSAEVDPLGTARRLLDWRDALWLSGWRGEATTTRLAALARVTAEVLPGMPDRLAALDAALARHAPDLETLVTFEPPEALPPAWRNIVESLAQGGTCLEHRALPSAPARGDLAASRAPAFAPAGDGSLQLLRSRAPLEAADAVAAWLAAQGDLAGTVILGADPVLDAALHRHGVPTTGAVPVTPDDAILQILPLVLALARRPPDPQRALELLTLPLGPVPPSIARRLAEALHEWPAVGSDTWNKALADGLAHLEDDADRERVATRLAALFDAPLSRDARYPVAEVRRRLVVLQRWLKGRSAAAPEAPHWEAALAQCAALFRLSEHAGLEAWTDAQLQRFVEEATSEVILPPPFPAEAGVASVATPGAIAGPARRVVWWSFTLATAPPLRAVPLAAENREALGASGIVLPHPGRAAVAQAARWRRPLLQTTDALLLVCPERGASGAEEYPHPLWDELVAQGADASAVARLARTTPLSATPLRSSARALLPLPTPRRAWTTTPGAVRPRDVESPTSLGDLLGCSLTWALDHAGRLRGGESAALRSGENLLGSLAHELLARVLGGPSRTPEEAEIAALRLFDLEGPRLAAPLFLPGAQASRAEARRSTSLAARSLYTLLAEGGLSVAAVERQIERDGLGAQLRGTPDLVLGPAPAIVDLKWAGGSYRRDALAAGTALQLAAYSHLARGDDGAYPPVSYFILAAQRLLTTDARAFPGAELVTGPGPRETWERVERAFGVQARELAAGRLEAPGNVSADGEVPREKDAVENGALVLAPPCRFCDRAVLCGRAFTEQA